LVSYPNVGYGFALGQYRDVVDRLMTGSPVRGGEISSSQPFPMLNYNRLSSTPPLPLPSLMWPQALQNSNERPAAIEMSSNTSLESRQSVWDVVTGKSVWSKTKRARSNEQRADSQVIRNFGGQCERCKKGKRKVCIVLYADYLVWH